MSEANNLPKGWDEDILETFLDYLQPTEFIVSSTEYNDNFKTPVLTAGKTFILGYTNETEGIFKRLPAIIFDDFTTAIKFVNFPFKVKSSAMKILVPTHKEVNIKYVHYFMETLRLNVDTHKRYWISVGSQVKFPVPPQNEQHRIVTKLDELFSSLDKAIERITTAKQQLKVYRQAVLKYAFEGRLTCKQTILPEKLGAVIEAPKYGTSQKCDYNTKGIAVLRIPNIGNGLIDKSDLKFAEFDDDEIESYRLQSGDILIIRSNGSIKIVGKCALITEKYEHFIYAGYLIRLRPKKEIVVAKYLLLVLSSHSLRMQIEDKAKSTSGVNNINTDEIKSLVIPLPNKAEQERIVCEIESRLSVCDKIEEGIENSLLQAEALRQSILKKAFEGKLVPQDPNDEPAIRLIERIKAERAKSEGIKVKKERKVKQAI